MIILDDLLILLLALAVAGMVLAPLESLHWWATQAPRRVETVEQPSSVELTASAVADARPRRFLVYLSGSGRWPPRTFEEELPFVKDLGDRLTDFTVIDDVFPYAVDNRGLTAERLLGKLWRRLRTVRMKNQTRRSRC